MKLIDVTDLILSADMENNRIHIKDIIKAPEIDPIYAIGACYCKECKYHEDEIYPDSEWEIKNNEECWCNWWDSTMKLNGFCSEGHI